MRRTTQLLALTSVIALMALPAAGFGGRSGGSDSSGGSERSISFEYEDDVILDDVIDDDGDTDGPMAAVPEPSAGLVFAAGALILAGRMRRSRR